MMRSQPKWQSSGAPPNLTFNGSGCAGNRGVLSTQGTKEPSAEQGPKEFSRRYRRSSRLQGCYTGRLESRWHGQVSRIRSVYLTIEVRVYGGHDGDKPFTPETLNGSCLLARHLLLLVITALPSSDPESRARTPLPESNPPFPQSLTEPRLTHSPHSASPAQSSKVAPQTNKTPKQPAASAKPYPCPTTLKPPPPSATPARNES